jgi:F0F1-type ATP synthase membrane subunit c/vacuolar-type H+-ATPase subunit K
MFLWQYILVGLLIALAAISKAIQDKLQFHFEKSIFKNLGDFWSPKTSWKRKWKNGDKKQGEAFFLSSTLLVSLTDAWHLFGLVRNFSLIFALSIATLNFWLLLGYLLFIGVFHLFFTYIFEVKK